jgi:hypothetical protein
LPTTNLIATSIASQSGTWTNLSSASLAAVDADRATATLGSIVTLGVTGAPSDYDTLVGLTLGVNWRISANITSRLRVIDVQLLLGGSAIATFRTPTQGTGSADRTDTFAVEGLSLTKEEVDSLQLRLTCTNASGGGASTANHLIDAAWVEIEYTSPPPPPPPSSARYFAEIGIDQKVLRVVVCTSREWLEGNLGGTWEETFIGHEEVQYCGPEWGFDPEWPVRFAPQWVQPTHAEDSYAEGVLVFHNGRIWKSTTPANVWEPGVSAWRDAPDEGYPMWVQPTGAHDAYALDDRVEHAGKVWQSTIAANVWEPGVYGWVEVTL